MTKIEKLLASIKQIFEAKDNEESSFKSLLNLLEKRNLYNYFNTDENLIPVVSSNELLDKANLLVALLELVLENPNFNEIKEQERNLLLQELYKSTSFIYEGLISNFSTDTNKNLEQIEILVMYAMLAYLADKQPVSDVVVKKYFDNFSDIDHQLNHIDDVISQLEINVYITIILLLINLKNYNGLLFLNDRIDKCTILLDKAQKIELEKQEIDIQNSLKITAIGNIIYLTKKVKEYLFNGKIEDESSQDVSSLIKVYSYNALHLLNSETIKMKLISHLLQYTYQKVVGNSIWKIAEKSPMIREFIEYNLSENGNFIYSLLPSQRKGISDVLTPKKSIIITMPTSAGKSFLAEMQILFSLHNYRTDKFAPTVCYIVPTNALMEQVKRDLKENFKKFEFNIETVLPFYDIDEIEEEILNRKHIDILISTPEKLESLVRGNHPSISNMRLVIMDEAHNISDAVRGSKFELVLAAIKQKFSNAHFLLLSPFISNAKELGSWLAESENESTIVSVEWAPTNQYIGANILNSRKDEAKIEFYKSSRNMIMTNDIEIKLRTNPRIMREKLECGSIDDTVKLAVLLEDFLTQKGHILVICRGGGVAKKNATLITRYFLTEEKIHDISSNSDVDRVLQLIKLELGEEDDLYFCVKHGICYHHSALSNLVKDGIEELIRKGYMKITFSTTTLAQGMNFPISSVIYSSTTLGGGSDLKEMTSSDFWNIAGRAGRAYKEKEGYIVILYAGSAKKTREKTKNYIKSDLETVVSSLNFFFKGNNQIELDYNFLQDPKNGPILNLIQYINHILNISYDYNLTVTDLTKIRTILNDSYLSHSLDKELGFIEAQRKINSFVTQYVKHTQDVKKEDLKNADKLGISDVSYSKVKSMIGAFIHSCKDNDDINFKVSKVILENKNIDRLAEIISIISRIPEIKVEMKGTGNFDSGNVARLLLGWVHGENVRTIASSIKRENQPLSDVIELCNKYLNSKMKSYMPWGINVYQELSYDLDTDNAKMLPSYIYYGVSDKKSVLVSKMGVPRFAVKSVLSFLESKNVDISVANFDHVKNLIKEIPGHAYKVNGVDSNVVKRFVDSKVED